MPDEPLSAEIISKAMRQIGRKGGQAKVPKGIAALSKRKRAALAKKAAAARWGKQKKAE